jgi:hypothetical protein
LGFIAQGRSVEKIKDMAAAESPKAILKKPATRPLLSGNQRWITVSPADI